MRSAAKKGRAAPGGKPRRGWIRRALRWVAIGVLAIYGLEAMALLYLRFLPPVTTAVQIEMRLEALLSGKPYEKRSEWRPLDSISPHLQHAVIAAEDARFYQHRGIDWKEVSKVAEEGLEKGELSRGASTISQQLVKNLFLTTWRSGIRKAFEVMLVPPAELILGKRRILELYLNVIEWGPGVYGAEAAAQYHYKTPASRLSREQAARLAAVIPAPDRRRPARMSNYGDEILTRMRQMGW